MYRIRWVCILLILCAAAAFFTGCAQTAGAPGQSFEATVLEVTDKTLLAEPAADSWARKCCDRVVVSIDHALIKDAKGTDLELSSLSIGSRITITLDGEIAESSPAQAQASKVILVSVQP